MSEPQDHSLTPLDQLRLAELGPRDKISPHFRLYELTVSELADRLGIDNRIPDDSTLRSAVHLARSVLEPVREAFGALTPNSVYRSQALERALKNKPASWISTSPHTRGCACDIEIVAKPTLEFAAWCAEQLPDYDQVICECYDPAKGPNAGWVHVGLNPPGGAANRHQRLSYVTDPRTGRLVYVAGLQADTA